MSWRFEPPDPIRPFRRLLLLVLAMGIVGTGLELLLLEHFEDAWQWAPLVLMGLALPILAWYAAAPGRVTVLTIRATMTLFLLSGIVGMILHYRGNVEFELEMSPEQGGWVLFRESMMGATPALAPGAMVLLGLLGLVATYRHPALQTLPPTRESEVP